jgi:NAD(P)H-nitrite reductase large subunit
MARWEKPQRDGKIGIIPDIKAGMLKPGELKDLAEIAQRFGTGVHLTSGQRLILLGIPPERVEEAKEALKEAGFDIGTSGKVVRNVRVCPGRDYCKKALQPTLELGKRLHERFTGIELPRPLKIGLSGCINSCSETYTRDIGMYGTSSGYKIYLGGKGGRKPMMGVFLKEVEAAKKEEIPQMIQRILDVYLANATSIERVGNVLARLGREPFQGAVEGRVVMAPFRKA